MMKLTHLGVSSDVQNPEPDRDDSPHRSEYGRGLRSRCFIPDFVFAWDSGCLIEELHDMENRPRSWGSRSCGIDKPELRVENTSSLSANMLPLNEKKRFSEERSQPYETSLRTLGKEYPSTGILSSATTLRTRFQEGRSDLTALADNASC